MRCKSGIIFLISLSLIFCASPQKKLQEARKTDPVYQYNMGLFFLNEGNIAEAIKYLKISLNLKPDYDLALCSLGLAYSMKGDLEQSIKHYNASIKVNPSLTEAHNFLGTVYQEMGFIDQAEREYRIAIVDVKFKSRQLPYYNLARLYITKDKLQEALVYVEEALKIYSNFTMAYNLKGIILERLNRLPDAIDSYLRALDRLAPEGRDKDVNISFNLAVAYFKNNEYSKAKDIFERIYLKVIDLEMKDKIDRFLRIINR
jgi:tetratricopeptide (TPR) repeat protein